MRNQRVNYLLVGSFVLVMLAGLIAAIALLAGRTGATQTYYTHFANVIGLKIGTQVMYEGYAVGQIENIELVPYEDGKAYRVAMSVDANLAIDADSRVYPTAPGFLSAMVLDIRAGDSGKVAEPGAELAGEPAADVVGALSDVASQVSALTESSLRPMLEELSKSLPATAANLQEMSANAKGLMAKENVERIGSILRNVDATSGQAAALLGELRETRAAVDGVLVRLDGMVAGNQGSVDQAVQDLQYTLAAIARRIDAMTNNLESMSRNMNEFSREIRSDPGVFLSGRPPSDEGQGEADARP